MLRDTPETPEVTETPETDEILEIQETQEITEALEITEIQETTEALETTETQEIQEKIVTASTVENLDISPKTVLPEEEKKEESVLFALLQLHLQFSESFEKKKCQILPLMKKRSLLLPTDDQAHLPEFVLWSTRQLKHLFTDGEKSMELNFKLPLTQELLTVS
jgi:hypothetical protein